MATSKSVWGIDIGQVALKAIKLRSAEGALQVDAFDIIEHASILSQPDVDRRQLIRNALEQFLARNDVADSTVVVAVPGHQSSFMRFVKLPPVDPKKIPDIVRFEAQQQIPFDINEVQWRYQIFRDPDSPDVEAGIFAVKQTDINDLMDRFTEVGMRVDVIQMPVMALYNFMTYDNQLASDGATLLVDIGADKTDLVVADGPRMWVRTIQIGGNNFTEALVKALKYPFGKAERLKRTAVSHKYARQIFQAMRPVFSDLAQEIRRSIGAYTATHRETRVRKLIGLGNGFRMPGLQKYLEQDLNIPVVPIDSYNQLGHSESVSTAAFTQNVLSFGVAYGLALQGLGETAISTNLLPEKVQEAIKWKRRQWWFAGAAAALLVALALPVAAKYKDKSRLEVNARNLTEAKERLASAKNQSQNYEQTRMKLDQEQKSIADLLSPLKYREVWPAIQSLVLNSFTKDQAQTDAYLQYGLSLEEPARLALMDELRKFGQELRFDGTFDIRRADRRVIFLTEMKATYFANLDEEWDREKLKDTNQTNRTAGNAPGGAPGTTPKTPVVATPTKISRGFIVKVKGSSPMSEGECNDFLQGGYGGIRETMAQQAATIRDTLSGKQLVDVPEIKVRRLDVGTAVPGGVAPPTGMAARSGTPIVRQPDSLFPEEDGSGDTQFEVDIKVVLTVDDPDPVPDAVR